MNAGGPLSAVTGAFGFTGKYITRRLLGAGHRVRTLTAHPNRPNPFGVPIEIAPLDFADGSRLAHHLEGAHTLYNTYWVRFPYGLADFEVAIRDTRTLFEAARAAGVRRIVHISIANPSLASPLPYFHGKAVVEHFLAQCGVSYAILRPTVIFGLEDILINNIAWLLRRFPVFAIPGRGDYRVQPVYVEDVAELAIRAAEGTDNVVMNATGPEEFSFENLVRLIREKTGSHAWLTHVSPGAALLSAKLLSLFVRDVMLTADEVTGLMGNLLAVNSPPSGETRFSVWLEENASRLGRRYASELARHYHIEARQSQGAFA